MNLREAIQSSQYYSKAVSFLIQIYIQNNRAVKSDEALKAKGDYSGSFGLKEKIYNSARLFWTAIL